MNKGYKHIVGIKGNTNTSQIYNRMLNLIHKRNPKSHTRNLFFNLPDWHEFKGLITHPVGEAVGKEACT